MLRAGNLTIFADSIRYRRDTGEPVVRRLMLSGLAEARVAGTEASGSCVSHRTSRDATGRHTLRAASVPSPTQSSSLEDTTDLDSLAFVPYPDSRYGESRTTKYTICRGTLWLNCDSAVFPFPSAEGSDIDK